MRSAPLRKSEATAFSPVISRGSHIQMTHVSDGELLHQRGQGFFSEDKPRYRKPTKLSEAIQMEVKDIKTGKGLSILK